jgi:hypothetical protein
LQTLHYQGNEAMFSFKKYITKMCKCFELLEDNDQGLLDAQKVKKMLEGVILTNQEVVSLKTVVRTNHPTNFDSASTLMATQITLLFPSPNNDPRNKRKVSAMMQQSQGPRAPNQGCGHGCNCNPVGAGGRGGGCGSGNGRGGGGGNACNRHPPMMLNGVNVSDPMHNFMSDEWKHLHESGFLSLLIDHCSGLANRQAGNPGGHGIPRGGRGDGHGHQVQIGAVTMIPEHDNSTLMDSNQGSGSQVTSAGGTAGARFGSLCYRQAGNNS